MTKIKNVSVEPRSMEAFKIIAHLWGKGTCEAETVFRGDGMQMGVVIEIKGHHPETLELNTFSPMYEIASAKVNGKPADDG